MFMSNSVSKFWTAYVQVLVVCMIEDEVARTMIPNVYETVHGWSLGEDEVTHHDFKCYKFKNVCFQIHMYKVA